MRNFKDGEVPRKESCDSFDIKLLLSSGNLKKNYRRILEKHFFTQTKVELGKISHCDGLNRILVIRFGQTVSFPPQKDCMLYAVILLTAWTLFINRINYKGTL